MEITKYTVNGIDLSDVKSIGGMIDMKVGSIIYQPVGIDKIIKTKGGTMYIQGEPDIVGIRVEEIIVLNREELNEEWFNLRIVPFGVADEVKIKYM